MSKTNETMQPEAVETGIYHTLWQAQAQYYT